MTSPAVKVNHYLQYSADRYDPTAQTLKDALCSESACTLALLGLCNQCEKYVAMRNGTIVVLKTNDNTFDYISEMKSSRSIVSRALHHPARDSVNDLDSPLDYMIAHYQMQSHSTKHASPARSEPATPPEVNIRTTPCSKEHMDDHHCPEQKKCILQHLSTHRCPPCPKAHAPNKMPTPPPSQRLPPLPEYRHPVPLTTVIQHIVDLFDTTVPEIWPGALPDDYPMDDRPYRFAVRDLTNILSNQAVKDLQVIDKQLITHISKDSQTQTVKPVPTERPKMTPPTLPLSLVYGSPICTTPVTPPPPLPSTHDENVSEHETVVSGIAPMSAGSTEPMPPFETATHPRGRTASIAPSEATRSFYEKRKQERPKMTFFEALAPRKQPRAPSRAPSSHHHHMGTTEPRDHPRKRSESKAPDTKEPLDAVIKRLEASFAAADRSAPQHYFASGKPVTPHLNPNRNPSEHGAESDLRHHLKYHEKRVSPYCCYCPDEIDEIL